MGNQKMNSNDFEEVQLVENTDCDNCKYNIIKGSIAHQNFEKGLLYCSNCWDKLRNQEKSK